MKNVKKYNEIMMRYRAGEFGRDSLSLHDILDRAGEPGLIDKMNSAEIQHLIDTSTGVTKSLFTSIKRKREGVTG